MSFFGNLVTGPIRLEMKIATKDILKELKMVKDALNKNSKVYEKGLDKSKFPDDILKTFNESFSQLIKAELDLTEALGKHLRAMEKLEQLTR